MALGRTRPLSISPGMTPEMQRLVGEARVLYRELDRRKPVATPTVFNDNSGRPPARDNPGRIIFVRQSGGAYQGQYSDGTNWNTFLASAVSFDTPAVTYGTAYSAGVNTKTLRTDAQIKFPQSLMFTGTTDRLTFAADGSGGGTLTSDVNFQIVAPTNITLTPGAAFINFQDLGPGDVGTSDIQLDGDTGFWNVISGAGFLFQITTFDAVSQNRGTGDSVVGIAIDHAHINERYGLDIQVIDNAPTLASKKVGMWNATCASLSGVWTGSTEIVAYDTTTFAVTPSATSGTALKAYGARFLAPGSLGTNGGFTETAAAIFKAASNTSSTVTLGAGVIVEMPRTSTTTQVGLEVTQASGGATPTDRIGLRFPAVVRGTNRYLIRAVADTTGTPTNNFGIDIAARSVGTNRWSFRGADKLENTATDFIASGTSMGFIGQYSDQAGRYFRLRALYNGGAPALTIDDVGTTLPAL